VINLAPEKRAVFREIARILKPGGRVAISDIVLTRPLPDEVASDEAAYCGCIAGAISADDYRAGLIEAGLKYVQVIDTRADLSAYSRVEEGSSCGCAPSAHPGADGAVAAVLSKYDVNDYAASVKVYAVKH